MIVFLVSTSGCITIIQSGFVGIEKTWGEYNPKELGTGMNTYIPIMQEIQSVPIKTMEIAEAISVPSNEGLIVGLEVSILFHYQPDKVSELYASVSDPLNTLIIPFTRNIVRDQIAGHTVKDVYSTARKDISNAILATMREALADRGIVIEAVLLRDVTLPAKVTQAIELKLQKEQEALQKDFELISAQKDATIRITEAGGIAEAQRIISESLTPAYLQYEFIKALTANDNNIIYVPTEANLPILEASRIG
ncbi:MAG: prohibitin family protein [Nanoarchaeota archaeon]|nr:prohibitin family protein [Nanoarchaeota archaeon]